MINKSLESVLKDSGYLHCIPLIEVCESDKNIRMIEVDKIVGFTKSKIINNQIEEYLAKLDIKIKYVDMRDRTKELDVETKETPKKPSCQNVVHAPFKRPMSKEKKIKMYENYKMKMFSVDSETYVNCPDCNNFEKL